jgi:putative hydrolase of the HAD superfamily
MRSSAAWPTCARCSTPGEHWAGSYQFSFFELSNTFWPRSWHEEIFRRDGVLDLIDGAVYSSEIGWTKPHRGAFEAAMAAGGMTDPAQCVFVGDRPFDDICGAKSAGMRAVLVPNSDVPSFPGAAPDAVISRLADLRPLIGSWLGEEPA